MSYKEAVAGQDAAGDLSNRLDAYEALLITVRLRTLDDLWTSYLDLADPEDQASLERDLPELRRLVQEIVYELRQLPDRVRRLRAIMEDLGDEVVDQGLIAMLASDPMGEEVGGDFRSGLGDYDFRGAVITACDYLHETAGTAERELQAKLESIAEGNFQPGDFKLPVRCALALAGAGAGVAGGVVTAIVTGDTSHIPAWLGITLTSLREWVKSGCPGSMREIGFGRRD